MVRPGNAVLFGASDQDRDRFRQHCWRGSLPVGACASRLRMTASTGAGRECLWNACYTDAQWQNLRVAEPQAPKSLHSMLLTTPVRRLLRYSRT
jgi:hypothetical protein